jgi:hypothetical protein
MSADKPTAPPEVPVSAEDFLLLDEQVFKRSVALGIFARHPNMSAEYVWELARRLWSAKPEDC